MIYAYILNNNILCCTYDLEFISEEYKNNVFVFENLDIGDEWKLKIENNQVVLKGESEIESEINKKIANEKRIIIRQKLQQIENSILSKYTQAEIQSWALKSIEATKIINNQVSNPQSGVPIIFNELLAKLGRSPTSQELIDRANEILQNKQAYEILSGKIAGVRSFFDNMDDQDLANYDIDNYFLNVFGI
jgi:hypothetical protein